MLRVIAEIGLGVLFLVGGVFNAAYTLGHSHEFYGGWADGAWSSAVGGLVRRVVVPNAIVITVLIIVFQVAVGIMILSRGALVKPALFAGSGFALAAAVASSPGGAAGNLTLAAVQLALALSR